MTFMCNRRSPDASQYVSFNEEPEPVTRRESVAWGLMTLLYLGIFAFNATIQESDSWGSYFFKLTQASAYLALMQHLLHPFSPIRNCIVNSTEMVKDVMLHPIPKQCIVPRRWPCVRGDDYTHSEGLSNLAVTLQLLITVMYWSLSSQIENVDAPKDQVNAVLMHGGIASIIFLDYVLNRRPYHLRHTLAVNLPVFAGLYTAWNYIGQRVNTVPVYPGIDWIEQPLNVVYALLLAAGSSLVLSGVLKFLTCLRNAEDRTRLFRCCASLRQQAGDDSRGGSLLSAVTSAEA